ncbi:MAG TPA: hypothetical protein VHM90_19735 [Phycisphaerae bacterium]|nr:hypothetical protein [Phycisphaerae bacterium]
MSDAKRDAAYSSFSTVAWIALSIIGLVWLLAALRGFFNLSFWTDERGRPEPISMYIIVASVLLCRASSGFLLPGGVLQSSLPGAF